MIRMGFWGIFQYDYHEQPSGKVLVTIQTPVLIGLLVQKADRTKL